MEPTSNLRGMPLSQVQRRLGQGVATLDRGVTGKASSLVKISEVNCLMKVAINYGLLSGDTNHILSMHLARG